MRSRILSGGAAPNAVIGSLGGSDNMLVRTDGTGGNTLQATSITVDDSNLVGFGTTVPTHTITLASTATGVVHYNTADQVTNYERARRSWATNVFEDLVEAGGSGTQRAYKIGTTANNITFSATTGTYTLAGVSGGLLTLDVTGNGALRMRGNLSTAAGACTRLGNVTSLTGSTTSQILATVEGTFNQTSTATATALLINPTFTAVGSGGGTFVRGVDNTTERFRIDTAGTPTFAAGTAPPASGSVVCGVKFSSTSNLGHYAGDGAPTFSAAKGSTYANTTATTTTTRFYINTDGGTTWTNFTTAA